MGMVGASYGGGIQLVTAAIDCRVDAIVPQIAWHSLGTSLYKADTSKRGWGDFLYTAAASRSARPAHHERARGERHDRRDQRRRQAVVHRSRPGRPGEQDHRADAVRAGHDRHAVHARRRRDQLRHPARQRRADRDALDVQRARRVPHESRQPGAARHRGARVAQPLREGRHQRAARRAVPSTSTRTASEFTADEYPPPASTPITATGKGSLDARSPTAARARPMRRATTGALGTISLPITPAKATNAVNVPITVTKAANVVGAPKLTLLLRRNVTRRRGTDARVRAARRRHDRPRARQPDHADPGHARRQGAHDDGPARDGRVHREAGRACSRCRSSRRRSPTRSRASAARSASTT